MAIKKRVQSHLVAVEIISQYDDAIDTEASDVDAYLVDPILNRQKLVMREGETPTVFVCNFAVKGKEQSKIKNAMIKGIDPEDQSAKLAYGTWSYTVCQLVLKGIKNPPGLGPNEIIEYKKDGRGHTADSTMDDLVECGVSQEIFNHYINMTSDEARASAKN